MYNEARSALPVPIRRHAHKRRLNDAQEGALQALIRASLPETHGLPYALWSKEAVRDLVLATYGELLPERTLVSYIERWGFAPERPLITLHRAHPIQIRAWMRSDYPVVAFQAKEQKATIYWFGISALRNKWSTDVSGRRIRAENEHHMLFVVSNRGNAVWKVFKGIPTTLETLAFLGKVVAKRTRKMFLIVPNSDAFRSEACQQWCRKFQQQVEIQLLPKTTTVHTAKLRGNGHIW